MKKIILFATVLLLLLIPLVSSQTGGGGGGRSEPILTTPAECNVLYNNAIAYYTDAAERANKVYMIFVVIVAVFAGYSIVSLLISLGMTLQKIKDAGLKQWWSDQWKKTGKTDETNRNKKR